MISNFVANVKKTMEQILQKNPKNKMKPIPFLLTLNTLSFFSVILLIIFYVIPDILFNLLTSAIGNAILLLGLIYLFFYANYKVCLLYLFGWIILYRILYSNTNSNSNKYQKEGFNQQQNQQNTWTPEQIDKYVRIQKLYNPNKIFATEQIQKFATQEELEYFFNSSPHMWPWSDQVEQEYKKQLNKNPYISNFAQEGLNNAKKIYSEGQIKQIMSDQARQNT